MVKSGLRTFLEFFVYGNFLVALCGIALAISTYFILDIPSENFSIPLLALISFSCLLVYNMNVFFLGEFDMKVGRERWKSENIKVIKLFTLFCIIPVLFYASLISWRTIQYLIVLGIVAGLYVIPIKWNGCYYSFRKIPFIKIFVLALVWSFVTVVLPAIENKVNMNQIWYLFIERMIFILAISIPFDIRDLERDKFQNTLTIPGAIGVNQSKVFAIVMILVFLFLSLVNYNWTYVSFSRIATSLIAVLFILSFQRIKDELVFLFILDGIMILHALNVVLIKNFCS